MSKRVEVTFRRLLGLANYTRVFELDRDVQHVDLGYGSAEAVAMNGDHLASWGMAANVEAIRILPEDDS